MGRKPKEDRIKQCPVYLRQSTFQLFGSEQKALEWIQKAYEEKVKELTATNQEEERRKTTPLIITDLTK